MSTTPPDVPRARFDRQAFAVLRQAADQALAEVPELAAVAVVCLWDLPGGDELPAAAVVVRPGATPDPDQLLRLVLAAGRLQRWLLDRAAEGVTALRDLTARLARAAQAAAGPSAPPEATPDRAPSDERHGPIDGPGGPRH